MKKRVAFHTLGCKVNQYETEAMEELFLREGYCLADESQAADVVVINTCTVTHTSDAKSRQQVRKMKRENPNAVIAVVGCYAQVAAETLSALPEVDIVLGTKGRQRLPALVDEVWRTGKQQIAVEDLDTVTDFDALTIETEQSTTRATVKIQEGCDMFCSYCIIPYARGHIASRPLSSIVKEAEALAARGFRELVFTGIHVASYGKDARFRTETPGMELTDVIEAVAAIPEIRRIRLSSIEPRWVTPEKLERLAATGKLCPHFHLSLQSGSDRILEKMNRHYTTAVYAEKVDAIRRVFPNAGLTTDVIVGFPEEGEKEFQDTLAFTRQIGFSRMHIFPYSPRQGTPAALFTGQVDAAIKKERAARLAEQEVTMRHAFMDRMIGKTLSVLTEEKRDEKGRISGYSGNYLRVALPASTEVQTRGEEGVDLHTGGVDVPSPEVNHIYSVRVVKRDGEELVGIATGEEKNA